MSFSSTTAAWIAIAAATVAVLSLVVAAVAWRKLRRVRGAQQVLLGDAKDDLVDFAVSRRESTTFTALSMRSRAVSRASIVASTAASRRPRSSATTHTRTRAGSNPPPWRFSMRAARASS